MSDPVPSCMNCPSLLSTSESAVFFKKAIGVPVCARFGTPIGRPGLPAEHGRAVARAVAKNCGFFGEVRPAVPDWPSVNMTVMLPDPKLIGAPQRDPHLVAACPGCANFVREDTVASETGFAASMCAAKGKLLLANRYTLEAKNCDVKTLGTTRGNLHGLSFLPVYEEDFSEINRSKLVKDALASFVAPEVYPTDRAVEDKDKHRIRAWREIVDPITHNSAWLPIYRDDFFPEDMRSLIPHTGDDQHPEDYLDHGGYVYKTAILWTELDETPALWGQAGTGKTEFFRHMAWLMQVPFQRFSIKASTEVDELEGKMRYTEGIGTHFEYGRFAKAWQSACVVVVDEYNVGQPDVQQFLRPCIDNSKQLVIDANNGEHLDRDVDCYLGMAMNPAWDVLNVGANVISDADANRLMHLFVELPSPDLEIEILRKRCEHDGFEISQDQLAMIMSVADDIRALAKEQTLPITWGIRPQLKVARSLRWFDPITAYKMAAADFLEPPQAELLMQTVRTHIEVV